MAGPGLVPGFPVVKTRVRLVLCAGTQFLKVAAKELFAKAGRGGLAPLQKALSPLELLRLARADFGVSIFSSRSPILSRGAHNLWPVAAFFRFGGSKINAHFYGPGCFEGPTAFWGPWGNQLPKNVAIGAIF